MNGKKFLKVYVAVLVFVILKPCGLNVLFKCLLSISLVQKESVVAEIDQQLSKFFIFKE